MARSSKGISRRKKTKSPYLGPQLNKLTPSWEIWSPCNVTIPHYQATISSLASPSMLRTPAPCTQQQCLPKTISKTYKCGSPMMPLLYIREKSQKRAQPTMSISDTSNRHRRNGSYSRSARMPMVRNSSVPLLAVRTYRSNDSILPSRSVCRRCRGRSSGSLRIPPHHQQMDSVPRIAYLHNTRSRNRHRSRICGIRS